MIAILLSLVACEPVPPRIVAVLTDRSDSVEDGSGSSCRGVARLLDRALALPGLDDRSRVLVLGTGDARVGLVELYPLTPLPVQRNRMHGARAVETARAALREDGARSCAERMAQAKVSPIYASVELALDQLRASGCGPDAACVLFVQSDLQETELPGLRERLAPPSPRRPVRSDAPAALDTRGVDVVVCGLADSRARALAPDAMERTRRTWTDILGPRVRFEPLCLAAPIQEQP